MLINDVYFDGYRNLDKSSISPCEGVNIIYGQNAQGKTNILELMWLFTGGRSFRGAKDKELIRFGEKRAEISIGFNSLGRNQKIKIAYTKIGEDVKKSIYLNGVKKASSSAIIGSFRGVVFSPVHLDLVKSGPNMRRRFVDAAMCQIEPSYAFYLARYNRALKSRNILLKNLNPDMLCNNAELDIWEEELAKTGSAVVKKRIEYCNKLRVYTDEIYKELCVDNEAIEIEYTHSLESVQGSEEELCESLKKRRTHDFKYGYTSVGAHRDDIDIKINGLCAKSFASQGQQRFIVLALKLAEARILKDGTDEKPVIFLDDVLSELDCDRQSYLLNNIEGFQVFITCCELNSLIKGSSVKLFNIKKGVISAENS